MPKPSLAEPYETLVSQIIETLLAGHHRWRPDLRYPESHSDMDGAVRGLLEMFEVKRRPLAITLPTAQPKLHVTATQTVGEDGSHIVGKFDDGGGIFIISPHKPADDR